MIKSLPIFLFLLLVVACSGNSTPENPYDPFEDVNRAVFSFNQKTDEAVIRPVFKGYRKVVPSPARTGIRNFLRNLRSPMIFANQLLQGNIKGAGNTFTRATVNTIIGVGGLIDVAAAEGIEYEVEGFGQTLGVWGVDSGPYLVLPLIGSSSLRDYSGYLVDIYFDPLSMYWRNIDENWAIWTRAGATYLDTRDEIMDGVKSLRDNSIDPYAAVRSAYYQHRADQLDNKGKNSGDTEVNDFEMGDFED